MTLRPPEDIVAARPDGAVAFAGDEGNLMLQDGAKAVFRGGVTADTGDFDVYQHDLVGDGDLIIPLDDVGGASLVNAGLVSLGDSSDAAFDADTVNNPTDASRPFTVTVEDLRKGADVLDPDESDVLLRRQPDAQTSVEQARIGNGIFSDNGRIIVSHAGLNTGENLINGSFNVQSGSTDAVQIRGADGTLQDPAEAADFESFAGVIETGLDELAASSTTFEQGVSVGDAAGAGDELARLDSRGSSVISVNIDATAAIDVQLQSSPDGLNWFDNVTEIDGSTDAELAQITSLRDDLQTGSRYVRVVLDSPATGTQTADVALEASG
mgnify:CR=1 FL=1